MLERIPEKHCASLRVWHRINVLLLILLNLTYLDIIHLTNIHYVFPMSIKNTLRWRLLWRCGSFSCSWSINFSIHWQTLPILTTIAVFAVWWFFYFPHFLNIFNLKFFCGEGTILLMWEMVECRQRTLVLNRHIDYFCIMVTKHMTHAM